MNAFLQRHLSSVTGMLSGFDRVRFRGTLRMLAHTGGFASFLRLAGVKIKDFGRYVQQTTEKLRQATEQAAREAGRPVLYVPDSGVSKEDQARAVAERDGVERGLLCVLKSVEPCFAYGLRGYGTPELRGCTRKCLHYYHYFVHPVFGFMHARLQSWFPLTMHVCINGREWLGRQMDAARIDYRRADNCFVEVSDAARAQALLDEQLKTNWPELLGEVAARVNPLHDEIFQPRPMEYYWSAEQTEWASDVMFKSPARLAELYPHLVRHGMQNLSSREVLRFLGRKVPQTGRLHRLLEAEVASELIERAEGVRVKHRVNRNSVKMYDKHRSVLRVETTLNQPNDMKVYRPKEGEPDGPKSWRPLRKGVADLHRRAELSQAANRRYLDSLATVHQPTALGQLAARLCRATKCRGCRARALNPLADGDVTLLAAVGRGEFTLTGFRNRDLRALLYSRAEQARAGKDPTLRRRQSAAVTRKLRLLRAHGLIKKLPRSHRYQLTENGRVIITALLAARSADTAKLLAA